MERSLFGLGGLSTTPIPPTPGGFAQMNNRMNRDFPGVPPFGGSNTRRPDVVIVNDASRPPTQDNIFRVVEMKFGSDTFDAAQRSSYQRIAPGRVIELDAKTCECGDDQKTQEQVAFVTAADAVRQSQVSTAMRALFGVGAVLAAIGTVVAFISPFDGPVGEVGLGTVTAGLAARVFASTALSAAARATLSRAAAASWIAIFGSGAAVGR
jgi:hypothetical protein